MKKLVFITCVMFAVLILFTATWGYSQTNKKVSVNIRAKSVPKSSVASPNIKSGTLLKSKAVAKSSSGDCTVNLDNYTGLYVKVYIDGNYKGTINPYSHITVIISGRTTLYCVSTTGTQEWSASGNCDGSYTYKLRYN